MSNSEDNTEKKLYWGMIEDLETGELFEKLGSEIEEQDRHLLNTLRQEFVLGRFSSHFYEQLKVLTGKYGK